MLSFKEYLIKREREREREREKAVGQRTSLWNPFVEEKVNRSVKRLQRFSLGEMATLFS